MQTIEITGSAERALVAEMSATLLQSEGRMKEAEAAYRLALAAMQQAGVGNSADSAAILNALALLQLREARYDDAPESSGRALQILTASADALPSDFVRLLHVRASLHSRLRKWRDSEQDLERAVSIADRIPAADPAWVKPLLADYAYVLRKNRHGRRARVMEARLARLPGQDLTAATIGLAALSPQASARRE